MRPSCVVSVDSDADYSAQWPINVIIVCVEKLSFCTKQQAVWNSEPEDMNLLDRYTAPSVVEQSRNPNESPSTFCLARALNFNIKHGFSSKQDFFFSALLLSLSINNKNPRRMFYSSSLWNLFLTTKARKKIYLLRRKKISESYNRILRPILSDLTYFQNNGKDLFLFSSFIFLSFGFFCDDDGKTNQIERREFQFESLSSFRVRRKRCEQQRQSANRF